MTEIELLDRANNLLCDAKSVSFTSLQEKIPPMAMEALACIALAAELRVRREKEWAQ